MDYQILIIFGINIPDTTGRQMTIYVSTSPNISFCTAWGKMKKQNITLSLNAISFGSNNAHLAHFV